LETARGQVNKNLSKNKVGPADLSGNFQITPFEHRHSQFAINHSDAALTDTPDMAPKATKMVASPAPASDTDYNTANEQAADKEEPGWKSNKTSRMRQENGKN